MALCILIRTVVLVSLAITPSLPLSLSLSLSLSLFLPPSLSPLPISPSSSYFPCVYARGVGHVCTLAGAVEHRHGGVYVLHRHMCMETEGNCD